MIPGQYRARGQRRYPVPGAAAPPPPSGIDGPLPGQHQWLNGASNFHFGSNDSLKWTPVNTTTSPTIKSLLADLQLPIIREWFPKYRTGKSGTQNTDADFEALIAVPLECGAAPLGVLYQWQDVPYLKHVVGLMGQRCLMYEFGNEPFGSDYPYPGYPQFVQQYVAAYKSTVPQLKAINPNAKFMGPSAPGDISTLLAMCDEMVRQGVHPDAITYHIYGPTSTILDRCQSARDVVDATFGPTMPLGLTEWNYSGGPYPLPSVMGDDAFMRNYVLTTEQALIAQGAVDFAIHFEIASDNQYPQPDLDMIQCNTEANVRGKGAYDGMGDAIGQYHP